MAAAAGDWRWSSVHAWLNPAAADGVTDTAAVLARVPDLADRFAAGEDAVKSERLRRAETIGRPLSGPALIARLERDSGRRLMPARPDPNPKARDDETGELFALSP